MNMKKTIAAVAAGAVAVSAMATTVSALEAKTLTYNLVKEVKQNNATGTVTYTFTNIATPASGTMDITILGTNQWDSVVKISGNYVDGAANSIFPETTFTERSWTDAYTRLAAGWNAWSHDVKVNVGTVADPNIKTVNGMTVQIPVGSNGVLAGTTFKTLTVTVDYFNLDKDTSYVGNVNDAIKDGKIGIALGNGSAWSYEDKFDTDDMWVSAAGVRKPDLTKADTFSTSSVNSIATAVKDKATIDGKTYSRLTFDQPTNSWLDMKDQSLSTVSFATADGAALDVKVALASTVDALFAAADSGRYALTFDGTDWVAAGTATITVPGASVTINNPYTGAAIAPANGDVVTVVWSKGKDYSAEVNKNFRVIGNADDGDVLLLWANQTGWAGSSDGVLTPVGRATSGAGQTSKKVPYHSALRNSIYNTTMVGGSLVSNDLTSGNAGSGDVLAWIGYANSDSSENKYNSDSVQIADAVRSIINDAVQNYSDVVFTFNTATSKVKIVRDQQGNITNYEYTNDGVKAPEKKDSGSEEIVDYTAFGRHFWDRDTGYDVNTIYINNDWLGNNLFEGALVINNNLTLSLGATDKFDWTATSLSFSWDAIQDAALTQNQYANYIQNMVLRTSTDWFWDNMTVTLGETEAEEVDSGAPVEADDTDLPEDEVEEDLGDIEEEEEEEEPVEDVEPEPEPEPAPVEEATNPGTGNASVALAVIPVALAAAAIVAKKRG